MDEFTEAEWKVFFDFEDTMFPDEQFVDRVPRITELDNSGEEIIDGTVGTKNEASNMNSYGSRAGSLSAAHRPKRQRLLAPAYPIDDAFAAQNDENKPKWCGLASFWTNARKRNNPIGTKYGHNKAGRRGKQACQECRKRKSKVDFIFVI